MLKLLLLLPFVCFASESPMKPSRPVPKECKEKIKEEHKKAKKIRHMVIDMHIPGAPKMVYRRIF